jgi:dienelactone hydrolase
VYPGSVHLFANSSLPGYDEAAAALVMRRAIDLLARIGR